MRTPTFALLMLVTGCAIRFGPADPVSIYSPDLTGPITDIEQVPGGSDVRVQVGDDTIEFGDEAPRSLFGETLTVGSLLIIGHEDQDTWYVVVPFRETGSFAGCFVLNSNAAFDDGDGITFSFGDEGVRLPKAPQFPTPERFIDADNQYPPDQTTFCLDVEGRVMDVAAN